LCAWLSIRQVVRSLVQAHAVGQPLEARILAQRVKQRVAAGVDQAGISQLSGPFQAHDRRIEIAPLRE
jgi:hypothetical protein